MAKNGKKVHKKKKSSEESFRSTTNENSKSLQCLRFVLPVIFAIVVFNARRQYRQLVEKEQERKSALQLELPCHYVMAESAIPNSGWGIFSLIDLSKGDQVLKPGPAIHTIDLEAKHAPGIIHLLEWYSWNAESWGAQNEGNSVHSFITGLGMLANGDVKARNVLSNGVVFNDPAGLLRGKSPAAGSSTLYHNITFFASNDITAGSELFVSYGREWESKMDTSVKVETTRSIEWLLENGVCLDHIEPGRSGHRGRGAFATRALKQGSIVAPLPLTVIHRSSLEMDDGPHQLLLNYCFGSPKSSLLFFPYSPAVTFINHDNEPNAIIRWSDTQNKDWFHLSADQLLETHKTGYVMEVVALRDIEQGEEIFIVYGPDWQSAWEAHEANFNASEQHSKDYVYPAIANQKIKGFRTPEELKEKPYPRNLQTACFYDYSISRIQQEPNPGDSSETVTKTKWTLTPRLRKLSNLQPCEIVKRTETADGFEYKVELKEYHGATIPKILGDNHRHFVTNVPHKFIRFIDKLFASDQHLPNAFRHSIGLPEGVFPDKWMDL